MTGGGSSHLYHTKQMNKKWLKCVHKIAAGLHASTPSLVFEGVVMMVEILVVLVVPLRFFLLFCTCDRKHCEAAFVLLEECCCTACRGNCNGLTWFSCFGATGSSCCDGLRGGTFATSCPLFSVKVSASLHLWTERHSRRTFLNLFALFIEQNGRL